MQPDARGHPSGGPDPKDRQPTGLRGRVRALIARVKAGARNLLGRAERTGRVTETEGNGNGRPPDTEVATDCSALEVDGRLRIYDGDGAYVESDEYRDIRR